MFCLLGELVGSGHQVDGWGAASPVHLRLYYTIELGEVGENIRVPFHGHVLADATQVEAGSAWSVDRDCTPVSGPGPTCGVVGSVSLVDAPLLGVGNDGLELGAALSGLDALCPYWDVAHTWIPGGGPLAVPAALVVGLSCAASGLLVGWWWLRLRVREWCSV